MRDKLNAAPPRPLWRRAKTARRARKSIVGGVSLALLASSLSVVGMVASPSTTAQAAPGNPGVPSAPVVLYSEGFETGTGTTPVNLEDYVGETGQTYTADAGWLTSCNGQIVNYDTPVTDRGNCGAEISSANLRQLVWALGEHADADDPAANHGVAAYTENNPGVGATEFETVDPISLATATGRYLTFSVDTSAVNCQVSAPLYQFSLLDDAGDATPVGGVINACSSGQTVPAPAVGDLPDRGVSVGTYTSNGSVLFSGSSLGVRMTNQNGSGIGNDAAFDNIQILDATPQLDKAFSPETAFVDATSTLTFTITNTSELAAKDGWSFSDTLPEGLVVADEPNVGGTCTADTTVGDDGASIAVANGQLPAGTASCTITVDVTSGTAGSYTNDADNIDDIVGLNPPGSTTVTFEDQPVFSCAPGAPGMLFQYPTGVPPTSIIGVDLVTGEYDTLDTIEDYTVNAVGYNVLDNYVYGINDFGDITRVGADGVAVPLSNPDEIPDNAFPIGEVDNEGYYWAGNGSVWWQVDLRPGSDTYGEVVDEGTFTLPAGIVSGADWAYIPGTGALWIVHRSSDGTNAHLGRFDLATQTMTVEADLGPLGGNLFGAVYADPDFLYASDNSTGSIFRIDVEAGRATFFAAGPASGTNDGTRCANSPLPIDFGDAPDSYGTTLASDGPRHSIPGFVDDAAPLGLGESVTSETDGTPGAGADGDVDDALPSPITLNANADTTVSVTVTNDTTQAATLAGWIDLDGNGTFDADELVSVSVPASSGTAQYTLTFPTGATVEGNTYARFRLFPGAVDAPLPTGSAAAGEVEDYLVLQRPIEVTKTSTATADSRPGDVITYTVTATNTGTADYTADDPAVVFDSLAGVVDDATFDEDSLTAVVDGAAAGEPGYAEPLISWVGALGAGDTVSLSYSVTLTGAGDGAVRNVSWVPADPTDETPEPPVCEEGGNDPETGEPCATTELLLPSLSIEKVADLDGTLQQGDEVTFTVTATNDGPGAFTEAAPASVVDDLTDVLDDAQLDLESVQASVGGEPVVVEPRIFWTGALAADESVEITYTVTYTGADDGDATLANVAFGPADPPDPENPPVTPSCNPRDEDGLDPETGLPCAFVTVPGGRLVVTKDVSPADGSTVAAGAELTYTITFDSTGSAPAEVDGWRDSLAGVLDDAEVTSGPTASDEALSVSEIADGVFSVDGVVPNGEAYTVSYTVTVLPDGERGDNTLANFVVPPGEEVPPPDTVCETGNPLCTGNLISEIVDAKSVAPESGTTVVSGEEVTYTLTFENIGTGAGSVDRVDDLTHVLDDADVTVAPTVSDEALSVSEIADNRISITGELAAGQVVTVSYTVTVREADAMGDATLANFLLDPEEETPEEPVCEEGDADCTSNPAPKVLDTKSSSPEDGTTVVSGVEVTYTLTFTNEGTAAGSVDRVDDLTHVLDDADVTVAPTASDEALSVSEVVDGRFSVTGELAVGQTVTVSYTVTVREVDAMGDATLANFVLDPEEETPEEPVCAEDDADCTSHTAPKVVDTKSVSPEDGAAVLPGQELTYTLTFSNEGSAAGAVDRVDDLTHVLDDAEVTVAPEASDEALEVSGIEDDRFSITGELAAGQTVTVTYTVVVRDALELGDGRVANFLLDPSDEPPAEPVCDEGDDDCSTNPIPNPVQTKSVDPESGSDVVPGQELTYTLSFVNLGQAPVDVDQVDDLTHVLDDAELVEGPTASDEALTVGEVVDGRFSITGELADRQSVTVTYTVMVDDNADLGDATLANFLLDPEEETPAEPVCEEGAVDCTINEAPKVVDSKSVDPEAGSSVRSGAELTYTLTFSNEGSADGGIVDRVDDLSHVLDDAEVTGAPEASDEALEVSEIADGRFSVTGELAAGQTVTVSYTVQVAEELGDAVLANFLLDPEQETPAEPVCTDGEDCTLNPVSDVVAAKSADPESGTAVEDGQQITYTLSFENTGEGSGVVDHVDHLAGVLDDADLVEAPVASDGLVVVQEGEQLLITGELAGSASATVSYTVEVRGWEDQGDHAVENFLTVAGQVPGGECDLDSTLCVLNSVLEPPADPADPPAPADPADPANPPLADTGAGSVLPLLAGLGLALTGAGVLIRRRRTQG
ncbi:DUF7927 domain-containing protein [Desertihabitans aurantiacus]|uniref:DUF7927 domain-containing protein n=1 Tax=Desertihabitans aurantiacus TaxID=2282477 RepID=UPI000DF75A56|nr:GEVED domain-containing protein [Desertihabitans aurantiacus]